MKLIAKKEQTPEKKPQGAEKLKKTAAKPAAAAGSARTKKPEVVKKGDLVKKSDSVKKTESQKRVVKKPGELPVAWLETARGYLREVTVELKKVIWPSRKETLGSTAVVLAIVGLAAVFLGIVDLILSRVVKLLAG
jgi:preprotein translocase subunit SecE